MSLLLYKTLKGSRNIQGFALIRAARITLFLYSVWEDYFQMKARKNFDVFCSFFENVIHLLSDCDFVFIWGIG